MQLSSAHKKRLANVARIATAGAMVVSSLSVAIAAPAQAAALNQVTLTVNNSRPSINTGVVYALKFRPVVTTTIHTVKVEFCTTANTFGTSCTAPAGFSIDNLTISGASSATGFGAGTGNAGTFTAPTTSTVQYVTGGSNPEALGTDHVLNIGAVTNPSALGTFFARIQTFSDAGVTVVDEGTAAAVILNSVEVTGRVLEQLTFTVTGVATSTACGTGAADTSNITTTNTTVPFGNYNSGTPRVGCQVVATATNAVGGYATSVEQYVQGTAPIGSMCRQTSSNCTNDGGGSGVSANDSIVNVGLSNNPAAWTGNGTGIFGLGVNANGGQRHTDFSSGEDFYRGFYNGSNGHAKVTVALNGGPTVAVNTNVVFKSDVPASQTAGVYQNRLMYVSTPTF